MNRNKQHDSWLLVGDFNRLPVRNEIGLNNQEEIVIPNANTRLNRILDYLIYGSHDNQVFQSMQNSRYR